MRRSKHGRADRLAEMLAPVLLLWAPFLNFSQHHDLPAWRPEILLCLAVLAALGVALAAVLALRPETLRPLGIAVLLGLSADLLYFSEDKDMFVVTLWDPATAVASWAIVAAVALGVASATFLFRRHLAPIMCASLATVIVVSVIMPSEAPTVAATPPIAPASAQSAAPSVLHLILDEHIGISGIPTDLPGGEELKRDLETFYIANGFALFPNAFSHYNSTFESVPNLMNGTAAATSRSNLVLDESGNRALKANRWLAALHARGYRLRVTRLDALDICSGEPAVDSCVVFPSAHLGQLRGTPVSIPQRAWIVMLSYLEGALTYRIGRRLYDNQVLHRDGTLGSMMQRAALETPMLGPISALAAFERLIDELGRPQPATAWVAHLLLPHRTYLFDASCAVRPDMRDWGRGRATIWSGEGYNSEATRAQSYATYFEQVRCTMTKLDEAFAAMRRAGTFDAATIVVHGDHGSRIDYRNLGADIADRVTERELIDNFSSLFAVRKPGLAPGLHRQQRSIHALFAELLLEQPLSTEAGEVFLDGGQQGGRFAPVPMPLLGP